MLRVNECRAGIDYGERGPKVEELRNLINSYQAKLEAKR